jgi:hypothetical protein
MDGLHKVKKAINNATLSIPRISSITERKTSLFFAKTVTSKTDVITFTNIVRNTRINNNLTEGIKATGTSNSLSINITVRDIIISKMPDKIIFE